MLEIGLAYFSTSEYAHCVAKNVSRNLIFAKPMVEESAVLHLWF
jgi:hypothetical protein